MLRAVLEAQREAVMVQQDGRVLYVNPAGARMLRKADTDMMAGRRLQEALPAEIARVLGELEASCEEEGAVREYQAGGRELETTASVIMLGTRRAIVTVTRDVTERYRSEEQLRRSQKMEALGRLVGGVAHDFSNVLTAIQIYSGLLLESLRDNGALRHHAQEIRLAGEQGAALVNQLMTLSRQQALEPKLVSLNSLVSGMADMVQRLVGEQVELRTALSQQSCEIKADPGQLQQVILNLSINARDAMPQGGQLTLATAVCEVDEALARQHPGLPPGPYATLTVSDSGCGMDAETRAHMFEPFFTTKKGKGTGLGLATVYGIVRQSGGHIVVDSHAGQGTTVRIFLPRALPGAGEAQDAAVAARQWPETILLVEDEDLVRRPLQEILTESGFEVLPARDGLEALKLSQGYAGPIRLMVTDVVMPHMGGCELAERLAPLRPEMGVLFISGYSDDPRARELAAAGTAFFRKPFSYEALVQKVREMMDPSARSTSLVS